LLLTGPQMGHSIPSIIHEVALDAPGVKVAGIDVPGIPAVVIGNTPNFAWGLTTGVADIADIVYAYKVGDAQYVHGTDTRPIQRMKREIKVKGHDPVQFDYARTDDGPVIFESRPTNSVFSQRMSYWKQEVQSWSCLYDLYGARAAGDIEKGVSEIAMNMNFFFATATGDTGWRYLGKMPIRGEGYDPRFPTPSKPDTDWKGFLKPEAMPHVRNPGAGLIANWNNKPASWWPTMDTPAWGSVFRNEVLLQSLTKEKLSAFDLERAAWDIARKDTESDSAFAGMFVRSLEGSPDATGLVGTTIGSYDGWVVIGSAGQLLYREAVRELRKELFTSSTGNFTSDSLFERVVQPSVMLNALAGKSHYDYLGGRKREDVVAKAVRQAFQTLAGRYGPEPAAWPANLGAFAAPNAPPVYYSNRGTYIQITELAPVPVARSVAAPGVTEAGQYSDSQVDLARQWIFKPVWRVANFEAK